MTRGVVIRTDRVFLRRNRARTVPPMSSLLIRRAHTRQPRAQPPRRAGLLRPAAGRHPARPRRRRAPRRALAVRRPRRRRPVRAHRPDRPDAPHVDVLTLNRAEVESLLDLGELLDGLRDGFTALTTGEVTAPGPQRADDARRGVPARDAGAAARRRDDGEDRHGLRVEPGPRPAEPPGDDRGPRRRDRRLPGVHRRDLHHGDPHERRGRGRHRRPRPQRLTRAGDHRRRRPGRAPPAHVPARARLRRDPDLLALRRGRAPAGGACILARTRWTIPRLPSAAPTSWRWPRTRRSR